MRNLSQFAMAGECIGHSTKKVTILTTNKINLAIGTEQEALVRMVCSLTARFEALVNELAQNNVISLERKSAIIGDDWKGLLDTQRIEDITRQTMRVRDADEELIAGN